MANDILLYEFEFVCTAAAVTQYQQQTPIQHRHIFGINRYRL